MTREEWAEELIRKMSTGFGLWPWIQEARDYLSGKEPPVKWSPAPKPPLKSAENKEKEEV